MIREINENNLNLLDEEASNYFSDPDNNFNENDFNSKAQQGLISQLKAQITKLKLCLEDKNKEIIEAEHQSTAVKIDFVKLQEQFLIKENIINDYSNQNAKLKSEKTLLLSENEELKSQIIELNNQLFEFNQKLSSLEMKSNFQKKLDSIAQSGSPHASSSFEKEKQYEIEISRLMSQIDEIQISKSKLSFEAKRLKIQLEEARRDKENEAQMNSKFFEQTIDSHKKTIASLQKQIADLNQKEHIKLKQFSNESIAKQSLSNQTLLIQLDEIGSRAKAFDSENYILNKKIQFYEDEIAEYKIKIDNKDKIIAKLQKDLDDFMFEYKKHFETADSSAQVKTEEMNELIQRNEELMNENNSLTNQNIELKNGLNEITVGLQDTNIVVKNQMSEIEAQLSNEQEKNQLFKEKIKSLKAKIDELYLEIETYKHQSKGQWQLNSQSQRLNTEPTMRREYPLASAEIEDPNEPNQRKTIEDYKQILKKVDMNLQKYKGGSVIKTSITVNKVSSGIGN